MLVGLLTGDLILQDKKKSGVDLKPGKKECLTFENHEIMLYVMIDQAEAEISFMHRKDLHAARMHNA